MEEGGLASDTGASARKALEPYSGVSDINDTTHKRHDHVHYIPVTSVCHLKIYQLKLGLQIIRFTS